MFGQILSCSQNSRLFQRINIGQTDSVYDNLDFYRHSITNKTRAAAQADIQCQCQISMRSIWFLLNFYLFLSSGKACCRGEYSNPS